jgi:hypothetical protein
MPALWSIATQPLGFAGESASADQGILDDVTESPRRIDRCARTSRRTVGSGMRGHFYTGSLHTGLDFCEQRGGRHRRRETCSDSAVESEHGRARSTDHADLECEQCADLRGIRRMERHPTDQWNDVVDADGLD